MMEDQLLEGFHHAWRGRVCLILSGSEREGNSREPTPSQRLLQYSEESRNLNQDLGVITGQQAADCLQPKPNSADLGERLWVKSYLWSVDFHRVSQSATE